MVKKGQEEKGGVGLGPSTWTEAGLLSDVDVTFMECEAATWDYFGKAPKGPAFKATLVPEDGDSINQYWSAGSATEFTASQDGKRFLPVGSQTGLNKGCNFILLVKSMIEAGFPADKLEDEDDVSIFDGMVAHVVRLPAPKRLGLKKAPRADGRIFEDTILLVDSIIKLPWESGKAASKGKGKSDAPDTEAAGFGEVAMDTVKKILEDNPAIEKKELLRLAYTELKSNKDVSKILNVINKEDFLSSGPWTYEDGTLINSEGD